jgi:murein tripeptide amidase MpaA
MTASPRPHGLRLLAAAALALAGAGLAAAGPAAAVSLPSAAVRATANGARACTTVLPPGPAVSQQPRTASRTGLLRARAAGTGDWDVAIFDRRSGRYLAGGAGPGADLAEGFVTAGQELLVQACHFGGAAGTGTVTLENTGLPLGAADGKVSVVTVQTPTRADKDRLMGLGLDPSEGATATSVDVVLHGAKDVLALTRAGFRSAVKIPDLLALDAANDRANRRYAAQTRASALPSGRDSYRHLADYEAEFKALALANPGLVKLIELPHKSLLGRTILGVEIGRDVNVERGLPVFVQLGVHHAREWPAGESPMEWAYELVRGNGHDPRVTNLIEHERTVIVPIVNPDGFNLTREAPLDLGNALAAVDLPPALDNPDVLPITDPTYTSALLLDQSLGGFAYKRRNCRVRDGAIPTAQDCGDPSNRTRGVDINRNYGGLWGGPGAGVTPEDDTYRGAAPFSEPEVQNVRELVSSRQVTALITNHTFQGLVLRPPGVRAQGPPVDEDAYKALGDAMAAQNGYVSEPSYGLYDTTGTTEDWSYPATGGFGFTFEIGKDQFHPPYPEMIREYTGPTELGGPGGNRGAYFVAAEWAAQAGNHSVLKGRAPAGTTLRLRKTFSTQTSPVLAADGSSGPPLSFQDTLDSQITVGASKRFEWHTNPSTRPAVAKPVVVSGVAGTAAKEIDISSPTPPLPGAPNAVRFTVPADGARELRITTGGTLGIDLVEDVDLYLYEGDPTPENEVGSSANAGADEAIVLADAKPGTAYTLLVQNYTAVGPYDGKIQFFGEQPGSRVVRAPAQESYVLTCERGGKVLRTAKVAVDRGQVKDLGDVCAKATATGKSRLKLAATVSPRRLRTAVRKGLAVRVQCRVVRCATLRAALTLDGAGAKRLGLTQRARRTVVARSATVKQVRGTRTLTLRFTSAARRALARTGTIGLTLTVFASDGARRTVSRTVAVRLR